LYTLKEVDHLTFAFTGWLTTWTDSGLIRQLS